MRWSDPEQEEWKREQNRKYGWGGTDSIWTGKFILLVIYLVGCGVLIELAVLQLLFGWSL